MAVDAVPSEPVSASKFPDNREIYREVARVTGPASAPEARKSGHRTGIFRHHSALSDDLDAGNCKHPIREPSPMDQGTRTVHPSVGAAKRKLHQSLGGLNGARAVSSSPEGAARGAFMPGSKP